MCANWKGTAKAGGGTGGKKGLPEKDRWFNKNQVCEKREGDGRRPSLEVHLAYKKGLRGSKETWRKKKQGPAGPQKRADSVLCQGKKTDLDRLSE